MLTKLVGTLALAIAIAAIMAAYSQPSALHLRQENQANFWPRAGTALSGRYVGGRWQASSLRSGYNEFRGGGPSTGK